MSAALVEFWLARIAEDETVARGHDPQDRSRPWAHYHHASRFNGPRVLTECEAKRRIVENLAACEAKYAATPNAYSQGARDAYLMAAKLHASTHADHPDYRDEWKP